MIFRILSFFNQNINVLFSVNRWLLQNFQITWRKRKDPDMTIPQTGGYC